MKSNHVLKDIILNANTNIHICKQNPQTKCGFHLQFADSTYTLQIPLTVADSATAQFNYTQCLIVCLWTPQTVLDSANMVADSANSSIFGAILSRTVS